MILTVTANAAIDKRYVCEKAETGEVNRVKTCTYSAGGKGLNVSRAAHIAGADVLATGFLGGHAGRYIEEKLNQEGVQSDFVWCDGESRSCVNIWDESKRVQTEFLEPGFSIDAAKMDELVKKFTELLPKCDVAEISGSMPKGGDISLYRGMIEAGRAAGKKVILDTSGQTLLEGIECAPFMIKPNTDEIQMITGKKVSTTEELIEAAEFLHGKGIPTVVISRGAEGSLMSCAEGVFAAHVPKIDAVNTVGCGDSMIGGFCVGISKGMSMAECLKYASAVSSAAAMTPYTGYFEKKDMEDLLDRITVEKIQ